MGLCMPIEVFLYGRIRRSDVQHTETRADNAGGRARSIYTYIDLGTCTWISSRYLGLKAT